MARFFITILANGLGIWLAEHFIKGFEFAGGILEIIGTAVVLAILNWAVRPIIKLITGPLIVLTLGLFIIVINGAMLWILDIIVPSLEIATFAALVWATLIMTAVNMVAGPIKGKK